MVNSESEILVSRFRPEQRARVAVDLKREDDMLREYIETGKLDFWFMNMLSSVESQVASGSLPTPGNAVITDLGTDTRSLQPTLE